MRDDTDPFPACVRCGHHAFNHLIRGEGAYGAGEEGPCQAGLAWDRCACPEFQWAVIDRA